MNMAGFSMARNPADAKIKQRQNQNPLTTTKANSHTSKVSRIQIAALAGTAAADSQQDLSGNLPKFSTSEVQILSPGNYKVKRHLRIITGFRKW